MAIDFAIGRGRETPRVLLALDFAFSFPEWFLDDRGATDAFSFWAMAEHEADKWIQSFPFWGRGASLIKPAGIPSEFRVTERQPGVTATSVFKLVGPSQVGLGSLTGMPHLRRLRECGWKVWPFEKTQAPLVIEIFPRVFTPGLVKRDPMARRAFALGLGLNEEQADLSTRFDGALDAMASALGIARILGLGAEFDLPDAPITLREGWIWDGRPVPSLN